MKKVLTILFFYALLAFEARSEYIPKSFKAEFKKVVQSLVRETKTEGSLFYQYPGKIKFITKGSTIVSNGKKVWYYRPARVESEKGEVRVSSVSKIPAAGMFDALNAKTSSEYKKIKKDDRLTYELNKKAIDKYGLKKIEFVDKSKNFKSIIDAQKMIVHTVNNKIETYELSTIDSNAKFMKSDFNFVIPANTNIK
jgi:outer membrane lipoprotein carrier protein